MSEITYLVFNVALWVGLLFCAIVVAFALVLLFMLGYGTYRLVRLVLYTIGRRPSASEIMPKETGSDDGRAA